MAWIFASGNNAIMARAAEADDGIMVDLSDAIENDRVVAIVTRRTGKYMRW